jgi:GxxExxY protein
MSKLLYKDMTYSILGACFNVYKSMGAGFLEAVYQECLEIEFSEQNISYDAQRQINLFYRNQKLVKYYIPDFICYDKIIIEIKAVSKICDEHRSQTLNYLNATSCKVALLINFGHTPKLEYERFVL